MTKNLRRIYMALIYLFLYAPIFVLIIYSFNEGKTRGMWTGFSLEWYQSLFSNREILAALRNTITVALIATIVSTILGTAGALGVCYYRLRFRRLILAINNIPVMNPDIVTAVGFMVVYRVLNLDTGYLTLVLSHIGFTVP